METKNKKREQKIVMLICVALIIILSVIFFNMKQNYLYTARERLIILSYQTNITGSDGQEWAKKLKNKFTDIPDFEVSTYETMSAGNESITITEENGWSQIVVRLSVKEGDILFVNNEVFYTTLLEQNLLYPIEGDFKRPITDENGTVYGIDITNMTADGLINYETSEYVGKGQPLPIKSIDETDFNYNGLSYAPRVIAVIYKGSERHTEAQNILRTLFGEDSV